MGELYSDQWLNRWRGWPGNSGWQLHVVCGHEITSKSTRNIVNFIRSPQPIVRGDRLLLSSDSNCVCLAILPEDVHLTTLDADNEVASRVYRSGVGVGVSTLAEPGKGMHTGFDVTLVCEWTSTIVSILLETKFSPVFTIIAAISTHIRSNHLAPHSLRTPLALHAYSEALYLEQFALNQPLLSHWLRYFSFPSLTLSVLTNPLPLVSIKLSFKHLMIPSH